MNYEFCYSLERAPEAFLNGTGQIIHQIWANCREEGTVNGWANMGNYHKGIPVPTAELKAVLDMPHSTGTEKQSKNWAYKQLLVAHVGDGAPIPWRGGWSKEDLQEYMDINDACLAEAVRANEYITVALGQTYPLRFNL